MLDEQEKMAIRAELDNSEESAAASVEALKIVQANRGFVSDEAISDISRELGITVDELESIATFYPFVFRKPVGKHLVLVCDGVVCYIVGHENIFAYLQQRLGIGPGETTRDGMFTLLPVSCIGACDHAPAIIIDGKMYGDLNTQRIDEILNEHSSLKT